MGAQDSHNTHFDNLLFIFPTHLIFQDPCFVHYTYLNFFARCSIHTDRLNAHWCVTSLPWYTSKFSPDVLVCSLNVCHDVPYIFLLEEFKVFILKQSGLSTVLKRTILTQQQEMLENSYIRWLLLFLKLLNQTAIYWKINIFLIILKKKQTWNCNHT